MKTIFLNLVIAVFALTSCSFLSKDQNLRSFKRNPSADQVGKSCSELIKYYISGTHNKSFRKTFSRYSSGISKEDEKKIFSVIDSLYFVDFKHSINELHEIAIGKKKISESGMEFRYNREPYKFFKEDNTDKKGVVAKALSLIQAKKDYEIRYRQDSIGNFRKSESYLASKRPPIDFKTFKKVHHILMKGGIDNLDESLLGQVRSMSVYGNEIATKGLTPEQVKNIDDNAYIFFEKQSIRRNGRANGKIWYPAARRVKDKTLNLIKKENPDLVANIKKYQANSRDGNEEELTELLVTALTEDIFDWFKRERDQLGNITNLSQFRKYVKLVSEFQRSLVSIHPFRDGNGRTTRVFGLNYPMIKEGFPPVRLFDPGEDLYGSARQWASQVEQGIMASSGLYEDLLIRAKLKLKIEDSPELLTPKILREVYLKTKLGEGKMMTEGPLSRVLLDNRQFLKFYELFMKNNRSLKNVLETETEEVFSKVLNGYDQFVKKNKYFIGTQEDPLKEKFFLNFVDRDYIELFGRNLSHSKKLWDMKMKFWHSEQIMWRGVSRQKEKIGEVEVINTFRNINSSLLSEESYKKGSFKEIALNRFEEFNEALFNGDLIGKIESSSTSFGHIASKNKDAERKLFSAKPDESYQALVGMNQGIKDLDFKGAEKVLSVGGADSDSIMVVQVLNNQGEVTLSYIRNIDRPSEIWKVEGDYQKTSQNIPNDKILKKIELFTK